MTQQRDLSLNLDRFTELNWLTSTHEIRNFTLKIFASDFSILSVARSARSIDPRHRFPTDITAVSLSDARNCSIEGHLFIRSLRRTSTSHPGTALRFHHRSSTTVTIHQDTATIARARRDLPRFRGNLRSHDSCSICFDCFSPSHWISFSTVIEPSSAWNDLFCTLCNALGHSCRIQTTSSQAYERNKFSPL